MNANVSYFVEELTKNFGFINDKFQNEIRCWNPASPPLTILFSAFGDAIYDHFSNMNDDSIIALFDKIEQGITSEDLILRTVVATGLIESLTIISIKNHDIWLKINEFLGGESKKHAEAWLNS